MNSSEMFLHVQVVFSQGKIKSFLAPKEILMDDFMRVVNLHGKVKRLRYQPDCTAAEAAAFVSQGATIVRVTRPQHAEGRA